MKTVCKVGLGIIVFGLALSTTTLSYGDDSVAGRIGHKLVRGVANTVTGWVEMPKQMYLKTTQGPPVIGTLQGIVEGVGLGFARTTAGLYEIATFPVPLPMHYEPLFQPEYVWQDEEEKEPD